MILVLCFALVGCGSQDVNNEEEQQSEETAASETTADENTIPETVEMYKIADDKGDWGFPTPYTHYLRGPGYVRMTLVYDTLVWKDKNGFAGALSKDWQWNEDGSEITFSLQENAFWHDGQKFTADDVVFTFDYIKEHPYPWVDTSNVAGAEKIDNYKVKISLKNPSATFMIRVADGVPIIPKHIYENISEPEKMNDIEKAVGTGPFKLVDYSKENGTYLYEANENYYLGKPFVKKLSFVKIGTQMIPAAVMDGTVNAGSIPGDMVEKAESSGKTVVSNIHGWNAKMMINHNQEPFDSIKFRKALAYAVNREKLAQISQRGFALAGSVGLFPPDSKWYCDDIEKYKLNPEKSKELLEELGYEFKDGFYNKDGEILEFEILTWSRFARDVELIKTDLENTGIKVNIKTLEKGTVDSKVTNWDFQIAVSGHGGIGGDPVVMKRVLLDKYHNSARYDKNERLKELAEEQTLTVDEEKRKELVDEMQIIYSDELPALTLYYPDSYWAHDGKVEFFNTPGGLALGIPMSLNRLAFIK